MRQFNLKAWLIALLVALLPSVASAVGLGRLTMLSALGDALNVEIELVSVSKEELATLSARISSADAYQQANLQYNAALVGARVSIERRGAQSYIKITSSRTVNEPFIDLLVEVTSSSGRLVREYTALVDPPGSGVAPAAAAAAPAARPAPAPVPPAAAPSPAPAPAASRPAAAPSAGGKEYGPIKRGENLSKIAKGVMHDGVTLEQMLVGLYRSNPDAFIRNNLNLVKAGRILRIPDKGEVESIAPAEAHKEYRAQVADWNSYRQNMAGAAGTARAEGRTTTTGRITARVDAAPGEKPKDVVRLSRGESPGDGKGKGGGGADRVRALEEEVLAREKALKEANERIGQLEKTIKDMQKLAELKSPAMAAAQQKAMEAAKAKAEEKAPPSKSEPKPAPKPDSMPAADKGGQPKAPEADAKKPDATAETAAPAPKPEAAASAPKPETAAAPEQPKPKPKPKPKVAAPPPPAPGVMDQVASAVTDPLYLGAGGGVIVLGGLGYWLARRRRSKSEVAEEPRKAAPVLGGAPAVSTESTVTMPAMAAAVAAPAAAAAVEDVDPLAEAEVYIAYGRDAQAEEILKEALVRNPGREDAQVKLLEIYSARKDKDGFNGVAADLHKRTNGGGDKWLAVAAMGYALDPSNPLYEAGRHAAAPAAGTATGSDLDFDLGGEAAGVATDITLDSGAAMQAVAHDTTAVLDAGELRNMAASADAMTETAASAPLMPDFNLDIPGTAGAPDAAAVTQTDVAFDAVPTQDGHVIDFQIELPKVDDAPQDRTQVLAEAPVTDAGLDFKLEVPDLDVGSPDPAAAAAGGEKDGHWYDVQTKFDLAKAYQEMGDKDGARDILQEVIKEGDAEQQEQAKKLLESIA